MTTSLTQVMNALAENKIDKYWAEYFRENFRGEINDRLTEAFETSGMNKADIARKLDRRPEQITRWLSAPSNLEADTISDIALAMGMKPVVRFESISLDKSNSEHHEFIIYCEQYNTNNNSITIYINENWETGAASTHFSASSSASGTTRVTQSSSSGTNIREVQHA